MQQQSFAGHIRNLKLHSLSDFGLRVSFTIDGARKGSVNCVAAGGVARELAESLREGDWMVVGGQEEPRPASASALTPWRGRFRVTRFAADMTTARAA